MRAVVSLMLVAGIAGCSGIPEDLLGPYTSDRGIVSVRESASGDRLRLRFFETGERLTFERDGSSWKGDDLTLVFDEDRFSLSGPDREITAAKVGMRQRQVTLPVDGAELYAALRLPPSPGPHPVVVVAQGSGDDAATRTYANPDFFVANGIAAAVYDKRGTGKSTGTYNHNFHQLSDDLVAIVNWVAQQPEVDSNDIGISGYSQGGWVGPLAAAKSDEVDFVIVNYGMINSPREEERIETVAAVAKHGYDGEYLAHVADLSEAAIEIMATDFQEGWENFNAIAERYAEEPWIRDLEGTTPGEFLSYPDWLVKLLGPYMGPGGLDWDYDSMRALDQLAERGVPMVWMIAENDGSAPNEFTLAELKRRIGNGEPIKLQVFENTDHGFLLVDVDEDGERTYSGNYHPDYYRTEVRFIKELVSETQ